MPRHQENLQEAYRRLYKHFGPQHWWPGDTTFEVIVGAILTQNTNWGNVERAIANLKEQNLLSPKAMRDIAHAELSRAIRPAGYFNVKAKRLKNFIQFLFSEYDGKLERMAKENTVVLREKLLSVNGVGPETADSILLYAFQKPVFVVDAYTKRFLFRHRVVDATHGYHEVQEKFLSALKPNRALFNEYHALIVKLGKEYCRPKPLCAACPLNRWHYSLTRRCPRCHRVLQGSKCDSC